MELLILLLIIVAGMAGGIGIVHDDVAVRTFLVCIAMLLMFISGMLLS